MSIFVTTFEANYLDAAMAIVEKANRKAKRSGIKDQFEVAASTTTVYTEVAGLKQATDVTTFAVIGKPLTIEGWAFVATISWDSETGLAVTRPVPGTDVDLSAHRDAQMCDHCGTRRSRKDTYVVQNTKTGETKQVGSNCLTAFLGIGVESALWLVDCEWEAIDSERMTAGEYRVGTTYILGVASATVALHGWVPASAEGRSTRDRVMNVLFPPKGNKDYELRLRREAEEILAAVENDEQAQARAEQVYAWVRSDEFNGDSEYVANLKAAVTGNTISLRNLGLVVSAISCWKRHNEQTQARIAQPVQVSEFVGSVGDRLRDLELTVKMVRWFEGDYGTTTLLAFTDPAGNAFKWFASGSYDFEVGTVVKLTGTVKAHEEYHGKLETVLTRCKIA